MKAFATIQRYLDGKFSEEQRRAAVKIIRRSSPVKALVSRHTRELLRRYYAAGKISTPIASRKVEDRFIDLSPLEAELYDEVEEYISTTYNKADENVRSAVGFVMTIYRRRLASSFQALRRTLENRKSDVGTPLTAAREQRLEEAIADYVESGDELDADAAGQKEDDALAYEELTNIDALLERIRRLPLDTKAASLMKVLDDLKGTGYRQCIVFTQFTDTMDYLRDRLSEEQRGSILCFSGRGGEIPANDGGWQKIGRDDVKQRFKSGQADLLLCTDAASEGLNFQFCGALINYDMPWNPMRVEQRIGRIDRLGQKFAEIRIVNLHYRDTVEADVYHALRERIDVFENVVGGLQPILTRLPELISESVLLGGESRPHVADELEQLIDDARNRSVDLDDLSDDDLDLPQRPEPALSLEDLREVLDDPSLLMPGYEAKAMGTSDYTLRSGALPAAVRISLNREFFEAHCENVEFWTPGNPAFPIFGDQRA